MKFVDYVNIKQGTDSIRRFSRGNTLPLVCTPNALNMFAPQTDSTRGPWYYHPVDRSFEGVRLTHQPSPWAGDFSCLCFLPQIDKLYVDPALRWSGFRPENAVLTPYYMEYYLLRHRTKFSLAPTDTGAIMTVDATENKGKSLFSIIPFDFKTEITVDKEKRTVYGYTCSLTEAPKNKDFKVYFALTFSTDIESIQTQPVGQNANAVGVILAENKYEVRCSASFISVEQAKLNIERELSGKSLQEISKSAEDKWEDLLSRLVIDADEKTKRTFYSCLYRTFIFPNKFYETGADGENYHVVPETGEIKKGVAYTNNGFWDTYRTVYPLYSIVRPEKLNEIIEGYLNIYDDTGVLPRWLTPSEVNYMPGTLIEAVLADCVCKNLLTERNKQRVYDAVIKNVEFKTNGDRVSRKCLDEYKTLGYVPYDKCIESVNETLDSAYGDYCISVIAKSVGQDEVAEKFLNRSQNYRNLFDKESGFMRPKHSNGQFKEPFDEFDWGGDYTEGGAWQNSFAVPHDYEGLASLYGGKEAFLRKIDQLFETPPYYKVNSYPLEIHEMAEMAAVDFGQCAISNQPSFHIPFTYAEFGEKEKTYNIVKKMTDELFSYKDGGFPGDEDNGTMASWYVFAVLGFYPTCPGKLEYAVSGNIVKSAILKTANGDVDIVKKINGVNKINHFDLVK
ncbi:MAG: glycoside hydrolase family 92 protein [Clostridiales bacterium]|nr:glycoside hydrolase family 92 protein [Clostridiales bacterium]